MVYIPDETQKITCIVAQAVLDQAYLLLLDMRWHTPNKNVWCLLSDGECAEGSIWESLRFIQEQKIDNLQVYVNINGMGAYDMIDANYLETRLRAFLPRIITWHS